MIRIARRAERARIGTGMQTWPIANVESALSRFASGIFKRAAQTGVGREAMPLRNHDLLCQPILDYLRDGEQPAWEIEEELAKQFKLTEAGRAQRYPKSGMPIWESDIAFGLKKLVEARRISRINSRRAPNGGKRGVYRLV